ncbi:MAG: HlyC/CorC family transporter [Chloroflexi bacterium]|nr:HlyC/CorC family transporter [Chloroflexota bacterium]
MTVEPWVAWISFGISIAVYLMSAFIASVYGAGPIAWTRGGDAESEGGILPPEVARLDFNGISAAARAFGLITTVSGAFSVAYALSDTSLSIGGSLAVAGLAFAGGYLSLAALVARANLSSRSRARSVSLPIGRLFNRLIAFPVFRLVSKHQSILDDDDAKSEDEALDDGLSLLEAAGISPDPGELEMIRAVMRLDRARIREIMQPRVDMVAADASLSLDELAGVMIDNGHSRIPIYEDSIDKIVGVVHAQDLLRARREAGTGPMPEIRGLARQALFVPESQMLNQLLLEFQRGRTQIAIVIDEYGGVSGLVAVQDLIEEIVGELVDEFDTDEPEMQRLSDLELRVDARMPLDTLKQELGVDINADGFDTIGGLIYQELGKMPQPGDQVTVDGLRLTVESTMGRRIRNIRVRRLMAPLDSK